MQILSYITLTVSIVFLYWCAFFAYDKSVRITTTDALPLFFKQNCIVQHIEREDSSLYDLSIYYSGIKQPERHENKKPNNEQKIKDEQIQQEILRIVKEKQKSTEENKVTRNIEKAMPNKTRNKIEVVKKKPKNVVMYENDAFSKKKPKKSSTKKSGNVFDVIE